MFAVPALAAKLLDHIRCAELLKPGDRVGVAVSGGADSTALLCLLLALRGELGLVLSVAHFNHGLRGAESDQDEHFVAELAHRHELEFHLASADTARYAREQRMSVEAAARDLRYAFFAEMAAGDAAQASAIAYTNEERTLSVQFPNPPAAGGPASSSSQASSSRLDKIATAHTLDDQAETVLMRIIRGTGLRGLGGIHPRVIVESGEADAAGGTQASELDRLPGHDERGERDENDGGERSGEVIRPLLPFRHRELEAYLREINQPWREDSSNRDSQFTRNRVRALLFPLLEREFNPSVTENLAELAEIARAEEDYWEGEVAGWMGTGIHWNEPDWARPASGTAGDLVQLQAPNPELQKRLAESGPLVMDATVDLVWLLSEPKAIQRRIVKAIGDLAGFPLEFKHIEEVLAFAERRDASGKQLALPLGWKAERTSAALTFRTPDLRRKERIPVDYAYPLSIPGRTSVPEAGCALEVRLIELESQDRQFESTGLQFKDEFEDAGYNRDQLFDPALVSEAVTVRNWRAGDRFWPAHTKAPKKVKELLQERSVTGAERKHWPVLERGGDVIWLRGFATPAGLQPGPGARRALLIREVPLDEEE